MTGNPQRKDAARNWQHIVDTARRFVDDGVPLRLNDVAKAAGTGVATVYRHFPVPEALLETVAAPALTRLADFADESLSAGDPWAAFAGFLTAGIDAQLTDASVQPVFAAATHVLPSTAELVTRLHTTAGQLLDRAREAQAIRPGITPEDVVRLMCGVVFAASVHATPEERPALTRTYLEIMLAGLGAVSR